MGMGVYVIYFTLHPNFRTNKSFTGLFSHHIFFYPGPFPESLAYDFFFLGNSFDYFLEVAKSFYSPFFCFTSDFQPI